MTTPELTAFGAVLRRSRLSAALSQEALAERAGLSVRALSDLERGVHREPRLETVRLLAAALALNEAQRADLLAAARPDAFPTLPERAEPILSALPQSPTRLVGREQEVATLCRLLAADRTRLVTLTGTGGSGKTRLAQTVASELLEAFADGVTFVDLAPLGDPDLVLPQIAAALGVRQVGGLSLGAAVSSALNGKRVLLILDNFEHLLGAAPVVSELLVASAGLQILATSRAPLRLRGELEFGVPPLHIPDLERLPDPEQLTAVEAVTLFVQRAQAVRADFAVTADNARAVASLCVQLDGLPLALELAATRIRILPPEAMAARIEHRLPLLTGGARDLPARQQTLRATMAWSYDLLAPDERQLFRLLAVFVGGATLEALEAVAADERGLDVLSGVTGLLEHNLLQRVEIPGDVPRFRMLETIREYGLECLETSGEAEQVHRRHAMWCLGLAERAGDRQRPALLGNPRDVAELEREYANFWAALFWLAQAGDAASVLRLAAGLGGFWNLRRHSGDGQAWLERALTQDDGTRPHERVRALTWLGMLLQSERSFALLDEAQLLARGAGDTVGLASATVSRAFAIFHGQGDTVLAAALGEESLALFEQEGVSWGADAARLILAKVAQQQGDVERATSLYGQLVAESRQQSGDVYITAQAFQSLGTLAQNRGDSEHALSCFAEALLRFHDLGDLGAVAWCLEGVAAAAVGPAHAERATRLFAAADALRTTIDVPLPPAERPACDRVVALLRSAMGETAFNDAWGHGEELPLDAALAEARLLAVAP